LKIGIQKFRLASEPVLHHPARVGEWYDLAEEVMSGIQLFKVFKEQTQTHTEHPLDRHTKIYQNPQMLNHEGFNSL
jgi:hypothetical protein